MESLQPELYTIRIQIQTTFRIHGLQNIGLLSFGSHLVLVCACVLMLWLWSDGGLIVGLGLVCQVRFC